MWLLDDRRANNDIDIYLALYVDYLPTLYAIAAAVAVAVAAVATVAAVVVYYVIA